MSMNRFAKSIIVLIFLVIASGKANASAERAWDFLVTSNGSIKSYPRVVEELVQDKLYFAAVPYIKEYLTRSPNIENKKIDRLIDTVVTYVGVKQFEVLPTQILRKTSAPSMKYILAKKYFRSGKYKDALQALNGTIPRSHTTKPFALFLEGSIHSIERRFKSSVATYKECVSESRKQIKKTRISNAKKQLEINRDYCLVGIARTQFANNDYESANLSYLDLDKRSPIWPEVLFEEAWNSFYLQDYNRTLGKLVTYKAPILQFLFNPEVPVLEAMTYLEMCLYEDAKKVSDKFQNEYENQHLGLSKLLRKNGKNYRYYYLLAKSRKDGRIRGNNLINRLLNKINRDSAYIELVDRFVSGKEEIERVNRISNQKLKRILTINLKESLLLQRNLIGAYVRKSLNIAEHHLERSLEALTYIKLEMLKRSKDRLYGIEPEPLRGRGDIRYIKRNEKQYFWSFEGEFWADELGDYVFSLKSECEVSL